MLFRSHPGSSNVLSLHFKNDSFKAETHSGFTFRLIFSTTSMDSLLLPPFVQPDRAINTQVIEINTFFMIDCF